MSTAERVAEIWDKLKTPLRKPVHVDEGALRLAIERANKAQRLLEDEDFMGLMDETMGFYMQAWKDSRIEDHELRERCHVAANLVDDMTNTLLSRVRNGDAARATLQKEQHRRSIKGPSAP